MNFPKEGKDVLKRLKILGFNGSPRKEWNTGTPLERALKGAVSQGVATESFHLYDLDYKGCRSCFACKTKENKSYGRCAAKDYLTSILGKLDEVDAIILASPIYLGTVTGEMKSFLERLCFPFATYTDPPGRLFPRKIRTAFIHTLGATEELAQSRGFDRYIAPIELSLQTIFGTSESLCSFDSYQFDDYSTMFAPRWDPDQKAKRRAEVFPADCRNAFEMGLRLAGKEMSDLIPIPQG